MTLEVQDLRAPMFSKIKDSVLSRLLPMAELRSYSHEDVIFQRGAGATHLFLVRSGAALLTHPLSEAVSVTISSVEPGYCFGWSALSPGSAYRTDALAQGKSTMIALPGNALLDLMAEDHTLGYQVLLAMTQVLQERLYARTDQFFRLLTQHPDLQAFLAE